MGISAAMALVFAGALLAAMVLLLSTGVRKVQQISGWILAPAGIGGLVLYTLAYLGEAGGPGEFLSAVIHGVYTTSLMFMGRNDYSSMTRLAPWFVEHIWIQVIFWLFHLAALFVSASAVLSILGKKLLQTMRLRFFRAKPLYLIYGLHEQSVYLGRSLAPQGMVVYVEPRPQPELQEQVLAFGGVVRQASLVDSRTNTRLMRLLGLTGGGGRKAVILALDKSETVNIRTVGVLIDYMTRENISPGRVRICLRSHGELDYSQLRQFEETSGNRYDVDAFSDAELSARLLIHEAPPYKTIRFDKTGRATEDFCALVIGFGQVGQHALRQMVMHGQFEGSQFSAMVVDRDAEQISGQFVRRYLGMMEEYNISFRNIDTRSHAFYDMLDELSPRLKYIVVCLGTDDMNYEVTADLERYFTRMDDASRPFILVSVCDKRHVATTQRNIRFFDRQQQVFSRSILLREEVDNMAKAVNFSYKEEMASAAGVESAWHSTDYYSRESSRASADFIPAMLHIAAIGEDQALDEAVFSEKVLENSLLLETLARTEHLRWNAFHFAMGYTRMEPEEVHRRADLGLRPIQKDALHLRHACLVDWDSLDEISALVGPLAGRPTLDYKELDFNNVRHIPRTLSINTLLEREKGDSV